MELVEVTGISKSAISQYLSGAFVPKQKNTYKLADALNVDPAWLMGREVNMEKKERIFDVFNFYVGISTVTGYKPYYIVLYNTTAYMKTFFIILTQNTVKYTL